MTTSTGRKHITLSIARRAALIGVATGLLEAGKFVLNAIPNVEVVTLFCALYGYVFGLYGIVSIYLFVGLEVLIWGFSAYSMWIVSYLIYWPLLGLIFWILGQRKVHNRVVITLIAVVMTVFFGVLTSLIDCGILGGFHNHFWKRFAIYYTRGVTFYVTQVICNLVLFITVFPTLAPLLTKLYANYVGNSPKNKPIKTPSASFDTLSKE